MLVISKTCLGLKTNNTIIGMFQLDDNGYKGNVGHLLPPILKGKSGAA